ncbi:hypothetical protein [Bacillus nitratireducens]|uniref:hypothetical protein n=1 Tax=Bacillus nitratireducens TaxID=2026193 RepID=UPI000BF80C6F|nr:hypothetical protein COI95_07310 [Bacillus cereus]
MKWTNEVIIDRIRELDALGVPLRGGAIQKKYNALYKALCRLFGNWASACEEAGVSIPANPKVTTAKVLKAIKPPEKEQASQLGKVYEDFKWITKEYEEQTRNLTWKLIGVLGLASDPFKAIPEKVGVNVKVFNDWLRGSGQLSYDDMVTIGRYLRELA